MGCGGSKNDVATGKSKTRKDSSPGSGRPNQAATNAARSSAKAMNVLDKTAVMKDIVENSTELKYGNVTVNCSPLDDVGTAKQITREPSERYFSSRKDESVDAVVGEGSMYFSPSPGPILWNGKTNVEAGRRSASAYVNYNSLSKEGDAMVLATDRELPLRKSESLKENEAEDLKEPIFVEITRSGGTW